MDFLGATLTRVFTRTRSGRATQICHNSPRWETRLQSAGDVTHQKRAEDLGDFEKVSWVENWTPNEKGRLSLPRRGLGQVSLEMGGGRWKSQNRKNVYLSPYVEEPLNSKVIKSFVPELRSRKCFSCFEIPMFYVYMLWTFYVYFTHPYLGMVQPY